MSAFNNKGIEAKESIPAVQVMNTNQVFGKRADLNIIPVLVNSGADVYKEYQKRSVKNDEMVVIVEKKDPKKSNLFGTFCLVKFGENFKSFFYELSNTTGNKAVSNLSRYGEKDMMINSVTAEIEYLQKIFLYKYAETVDFSAIKMGIVF